MDAMERDRKLGGQVAFAFFLVGAPAALAIGVATDRVSQLVYQWISQAILSYWCDVKIGELTHMATNWEDKSRGLNRRDWLEGYVLQLLIFAVVNRQHTSFEKGQGLRLLVFRGTRTKALRIFREGQLELLEPQGLGFANVLSRSLGHSPLFGLRPHRLFCVCVCVASRFRMPSLMNMMCML